MLWRWWCKCEGVASVIRVWQRDETSLLRVQPPPVGWKGEDFDDHDRLFCWYVCSINKKQVTRTDSKNLIRITRIQDDVLKEFPGLRITPDAAGGIILFSSAAWYPLKCSCVAALCYTNFYPGSAISHPLQLYSSYFALPLTGLPVDWSPAILLHQSIFCLCLCNGGHWSVLLDLFHPVLIPLGSCFNSAKYLFVACRELSGYHTDTESSS